jgi:hypothetical protein
MACPIRDCFRGYIVNCFEFVLKYLQLVFRSSFFRSIVRWRINVCGSLWSVKRSWGIEMKRQTILRYWNEASNDLEVAIEIKRQMILRYWNEASNDLEVLKWSVKRLEVLKWSVKWSWGIEIKRQMILRYWNEASMILRNWTSSTDQQKSYSLQKLIYNNIN